MATFNRFRAKHGLDNNANSITNLGVSGASLALAGANALTLTTTGATNVTLPTSGTLVTTDGNARVGVENNGVLVGTRRNINFIAGSNVTLTITDDAGNEEVDVTIAASGGGGLTGSGTTNELAYWTGASALGTLTTATYPSLTELSYVKGVTSAIQTQLAGRATLAGDNAFTGASTFTNTTGQTFRQTAVQDGIRIQGRAGGTLGYVATLNTEALTLDRTITLPDATTVLVGNDTGVTLTNKTYSLGIGTANRVLISNGAGTLTSSANLTWDATNNRLGIGATYISSAALYVVRAATQARIAYDASNYFDISVGATGGVTLDAVGTGARFTFSDNITVGAGASRFDSPSATTIFIGSGAGATRSSGSSQIGIGYQSLGVGALTGSNLTAVGDSSFRSVTSAVNSVAVGSQAGYSLTTGSSNTFVGHNAGYSVTTATQNVCIGENSYLYGTNSNNVFIGRNSGIGVSGSTNGYQNVAVGQGTMAALTSGYDNVAIGNGAGAALTSGTGNVFIGPAAGSTETTNSNRLYIANSNTSTPLIFGNFSTPSLTFNGSVTIQDARNLTFGTTTGTKIGTATSEKIAFYNATPIVQPTTGVAAATFVANTGTAVNDASTFDGYTIGQVVKALRNLGLLA